MKIFFATFANTTFMNSNRIAKQAFELNIFDKIFQYTEKDIYEFIDKHQEFINTHPEGYGYYIWKPKVILDILNKLDNNNILIYCDAGVYLNKNGINRLNEYLEKLNDINIDIITFSANNNYKAKYFIKMDAIMNYYPKFNEECLDINAVYAGIIIIKKSTKTLNVITDWLNLCENYNFLNTCTSINYNEASYFVGNDKDIGLFNLCLSKYKISYAIYPDETNIYTDDGSQIHHTNIDVNNINWSSLDDKPFHNRRIIPKFNYSNDILNEEIIKQDKAYFLSHNGLGDNITSISAINFLLKYYKTIYLLCKDIYEENIKLLYSNKPVIIISFNSNNEFEDCSKIINNAYNNDKNIDIFICGCHKSYLNSKISHPDLLNYKQTDKNYIINYNFIKDFYYDIKLDLSIYYEYFDISESDISKYYYTIIKEYKIIFLHTKSSNKEINLDIIINKYINNSEYIIICTNKNIYPIDHYKYYIANQYINILLGYYITLIKNSNEIHVIDSCFSCIIYPMSKTNKLKASNIIIYNRDS
jgi:hypothetical protein